MSGKLNLNNIKDEAVKDIIELQKRINAFKKGEANEDKFKHYRLTRGVYGQRQTGVHMFRTKIPYGKLNPDQLIRLADVSEKYTNGNLHLTTRQNIQLHYVKLDDSPAIWAELAEVEVTAREACGNTVRNLTASAKAGIDPEEPFDVTPYVHASFEYFLRNPICQEMGRKIKPAFSSSERDSAFTYFHDFGFIPRIKVIDGQEIKGFKVVIAGGLGAQALIAPTAYEFLEADKIIPFMEAAIRVFDRYGEREKRFKARMKFLLKKLGLEALLALIEEELASLKNQRIAIETVDYQDAQPPELRKEDQVINDSKKYENWLATNVFEQKQKGFFGVQVKVKLGDIQAERARLFAEVVRKYAAPDIRITVNQGFLLRFVHPQFLIPLFNHLNELGLAEPGFDSIADITACPGTDTCNLAVTNSTALSDVLEKLATEEYPELINDKNLTIKISGCMNSCGQHMAASIGLHGSSIKKNGRVIPAMQIVLGGGVDPNGKGFIAEKIIKLPTKRIPQAISWVLDSYLKDTERSILFNAYFQEKGKRFFYDLLKPFSDVATIEDEEFADWGQQDDYIQAIGVGECAGVSYDVVASIIADALEKLALGNESLENKHFADSIYNNYSAQVIGAKALLLMKDVKCNTHISIINDFQTHYVENNEIKLNQDFPSLVLKMKKEKPTPEFATSYKKQAEDFLQKVIDLRTQFLDGSDKEVVSNYYNA